MRRLTGVLVMTALLIVTLAVASSAGAAAQARTQSAKRFDKVVDSLVSRGWPQRMEKALVTFSAAPAPFRIAGSRSDTQAARWLALQMQGIGLTRVRLEPVPVDAWTFTRASVAVGGRVMKASSFAGEQGTKPSGITAELKYIGGGTKAEFDAAGDMHGKIALIDCMFASWWMTTPAMEAGLRGCSGIVFTYTAADPTMYSIAPDALGSYDWPASPSTPPAVYVSAEDGDWLKAQLETSVVSATLKSDAKLRLMEDGGVAFNTVGMIRGRDPRAPFVLVAAHRDGYFTAASDNGAGVVTMLLLAKAMKAAGVTPERSIVFVSTTAEEYGWTDSNFDYLIGSWWSITRTHPDWSGTIAAMLNTDFGAVKGSSLKAATDATLLDYARAVAKADTDISTVNGTPMTITGENQSWTDSETFALAGVPTFDLECEVPQESPYSGFVHTDYDRPGLLDYSLMGKAVKYDQRFISGLGHGILPHALSPRAESLAAEVDVAALEAAGVAPDTVDRLKEALVEFGAAADLYDAGRAGIPVQMRAPTNRRLLQVVARLNRGLLALDPYGFIKYPHQQTLADVQHMLTAADALGQADGDTAYWELVSVGHTWTGMNFSRETYQKFLRLQRPGYDRLTWTELGDPAIYQNLQPELALIEAGDLADARDSLERKLHVQQADLERRVAQMAELLERVAPAILDLLPVGAGGS